jgi:FkbM family methyltransferase
MSIRGMAEYLSRGVVLRRRLPSKFGRIPIYVTPEAGLRYWGAMSQVDPVLYSMAEEIVKPGSVVWDVGANVGLFSLCAAALSGPGGLVLAVEPDPWLAHLIDRSSQLLNGGEYPCAEVEVLCASISDSDRISKLAVAERARASNYLIESAGSTQAMGARCLQSTVSLTLDYLLDYFPPPSVLKIDVEAHEVCVLKGATRLLNQIQPTIWCEVSAQNSQELTSLLHGAKYDLYGAQVQPHPQIKRAWFHTLAIPAGLDRTDSSVYGPYRTAESSPVFGELVQPAHAGRAEA